MSSCAYLDIASLVAQRCASARLGRRCSPLNGPQALCATARRAPLLSSVQGSTKQASTSAVAHTQVLQHVDDVYAPPSVDGGLDVHGLLQSEHPSRRPQRDRHIAGSDSSVESFLPTLRYDLDQQRLEEQRGNGLHLGEGSVGQVDTHQVQPLAAPATQHQHQDYYDDFDELLPADLDTVHISSSAPQRHTEQLMPRKAWPPRQAQQALSASQPLPPATPSAAHPALQHANPSNHDRGLPAPLHQHAVATRPQQDSTPIQLPEQPSPDGLGQQHVSRGRADSWDGGGGGFGSGSGWGGDYEGAGGGGGGNGGGSESAAELERQLRACSTCRSLQRFVQLHRPHLTPSLLAAALVHLSHVAAEDPPLDAMEQQRVAGLLLDLASRLRTRRSSSSSSTAAQPTSHMLRPGDNGASAAAGSLAASSAGEGDSVADAGEGGSYAASGGGRGSSSSGGSLAHGGAGAIPSVAMGGLALLNAGELTSAVCALSRMGYYDPPLLREAAEAARDAAEDGRVSAYQAAGLLWAFSRYHRDYSFPLDPACTSALLDALVDRLPSARPQHLSMALYALALLRHTPPQGALSAILSASLFLMPSFDGRELAMALWALANLHIDPGPEWMSAFLARCEAATRTFASGAAVANVLWGLAVLDQRPPARWMGHFLWQAQRRMGHMDGQSLVMTVWALARMKYRPDSAWCARLLRYSRMRLLQQHAPVTAGSGGQQQQQQEGQQRVVSGGRLVDGGWAAWVLQGGAAGAQAGAGPGAGADEPPHPGVQGAARARAAAERATTQAFNNLLWSLARLNIRPKGTWLEHFCRAVQPRLVAMPPREHAALLWSLARLSGRPAEDWVVELFAAMRAALPRYQPPECVMAILGLGRMCSAVRMYVTDQELADQLVRQLEPHLPRLQTTTLVSVLLAMARIHPGLQPVRFGPPLQVLLARVRSAPPGAISSRQLANAAFAVGCVVRRAGRSRGVRQLCGELFQEVMPRLDERFGELNVPDLVVVAQGAAAARLRLWPEWLRRHEHVAAARLQHARAANGPVGQPVDKHLAGVHHEHLVLLHRAYRVLGYEPAVLPGVTEEDLVGKRKKKRGQAQGQGQAEAEAQGQGQEPKGQRQEPKGQEQDQKGQVAPGA